MTKRLLINHLNDLNPKEWLKFQKSWFVHNPPPRSKKTLRHPAKFPETLAQEFIHFFTKQGQWVLDPMAGTASTLVAALRSGRHSIGIELNPIYIKLAQDILEEERKNFPDQTKNLTSNIIQGNAADLPQIAKQQNYPLFDYVITSPPYWDMLHARGAQTQKKRRNSSELDLFYSNDPRDLGNIEDYDEFLKQLIHIYRTLKPCIKDKAYLTIIVKNIKKGGKIYPLAWDLARRLGEIYQLKDEKLWLQDNQSLAPYGMGNTWVSNTFHHYCLQFRNL